MKKYKPKMNKLVLLGFIAIVLIIITFLLYFYSNRKIYINEIDEVEAEKIMSSRDEYSDIIKLYYNNSSIPYNEEGNYYLFYETNENEYLEIYNIGKFKVSIINKEENSIDILLYNNFYYKTTKIEITNIPVVSIQTSRVEDENSYGGIYLYSTNDKLNSTNVSYYNCEFHLRGNASRSADKKSYRLTILDNIGDEVEVSLLGMNSDGDWILNPIYSDETYMREKIGYDIWNSLSGEYTHQLEYIELIIDGVYQGIYCLQEVVDLDTFSANKNTDLLVSVKTWEHETARTIFDVEYTGNEEQIDEFEIEKGLNNNISKRVEVLRSFINKKNGNDEYNVEYDFENNANYQLFVNLILAIDNEYKNEKILFRDMGDYYLIQKTPWDLDFSMSSKYLTQVTGHVWDISVIYYDVSISDELLNSDEFIQCQKEQYLKIKETIYNEETLNSIIDSYVDYLQESGAVERDVEKWGDNGFEEGIQTVKDFFRDRIEVLDEYYLDIRG